MGGPRLAAHLQKFLLQFRHPRAAGIRFRGLAGRLGHHGRGHVGENNHDQTLQRPGILQPPDGHIHALRAAVRPNLESVQRHPFFFSQRFLEGVRQFITQPFPGHGKNIPVRFTGSWFEIFAGAAADVKNIARLIGNHGGRGVTLQHQLVRQRLETGGRAGRRPRLGNHRRTGGKGRGKDDRIRSQDGFRPPEEPRLGAQRDKEISEIPDRLGAALKQNAAGQQAVVKQRNQFLLHLGGQINQQVAAAQDVQLGEGRVHDEILRGKDDHLANLFAHPVAMLFLLEEALQPGFRNIGGDVGQKETRPGLFNCVQVQVRGENLNRKLSPGLDRFERLFEHDGQGISLFPRGATGHPRAQRLVGHAAGEQRGNGRFGQLLPGGGVAKKIRHADQQFPKQQIQLLRILLQVADISRHLFDLVKAHAALDPAIQRVPFVKSKVVARVGAQQNDHLFQRALRLVFQHRFRPGEERGALQIGEDFPRQLFRPGHDIRQPRVNRAARHGVEFGRRRLLHQHHAGFFLDGAQPQRAIRAHAGKNHAHAVLLLILRQRAEEKINRQPHPAHGGRLEQVQDAVQDGHVLVRRDHIDAVRPHWGAVLDLDHLHAGGALEQFAHDAFTCRIEVLNNNERHAAALRHAPQELIQGFESARRRTDADNGKRRARGGSKGFQMDLFGGSFG